MELRSQAQGWVSRKADVSRVQRRDRGGVSCCCQGGVLESGTSEQDGPATSSTHTLLSVEQILLLPHFQPTGLVLTFLSAE